MFVKCVYLVTEVKYEEVNDFNELEGVNIYYYYI